MSICKPSQTLGHSRGGEPQQQSKIYRCALDSQPAYEAVKLAVTHFSDCGPQVSASPSNPGYCLENVGSVGKDLHLTNFSYDQACRHLSQWLFENQHLLDGHTRCDAAWSILCAFRLPDDNHQQVTFNRAGLNYPNASLIPAPKSLQSNLSTAPGPPSFIRRAPSSTITDEHRLLASPPSSSLSLVHTQDQLLAFVGAWANNTTGIDDLFDERDLEV